MLSPNAFVLFIIFEIVHRVYKPTKKRIKSSSMRFRAVHFLLISLF